MGQFKKCIKFQSCLCYVVLVINRIKKKTHLAITTLKKPQHLPLPLKIVHVM